MLAKRSALCFIIFFCYHKFCHRRCEFIEFIYWTVDSVSGDYHWTWTLWRSERTFWRPFSWSGMSNCGLQSSAAFYDAAFFGARTRLLWRTLDGLLDEKLRHTMSQQWSHWKLLPRNKRISISHHPQFVSIGWDVKREINEISHATLNLSLTA